MNRIALLLFVPYIEIPYPTMNYFGYFFLGMAFVACQSGEPAATPINRRPISTIKNEKKQVEVYDFESFKPFLNPPNDSLYVLNFWATWCAPCVAELPYFEQLHQQYADKKVKVILVSLDFTNQLESKLLPFLQTKNLSPEVIVLDQKNVNQWIDQVDSRWSGAIPATLLIQEKKRAFYEQSFDYAELEKVVTAF